MEARHTVQSGSVRVDTVPERARQGHDLWAGAVSGFLGVTGPLVALSSGSKEPGGRAGSPSRPQQAGRTRAAGPGLALAQSSGPGASRM